MGRAGSIGGVIVVLLMIGLGFANAYWRKSRTGEEFRVAVHKMIADKCEGYKENQEYIDWLVDVSHDEAFAKNYHMNYTPRSRYRASRDESTFDLDAYADELFAGMIARAREDKAENIVVAIEKMKKTLEEEGDKEEAAAASASASKAAVSPQRGTAGKH
ncbi:MAG: hypothetical protein U0573_00520 [Phycisphaerales bacterium]|nr:hypothetical protein [Planctomycetota bacterium]